MADGSDLDCRFYIDAGQPLEGVAAFLAGALARPAEGGPAGKTLRTPWGEIELRRNDEADPIRAADFPDGFLHFRYTAEFYPSSGAASEDRVSLAAKVLSALWGRGLPAVAVCDYEARLPKGGGYKDRTAPWPSRPPQAAGLIPGHGQATQEV